MKSVLGESVTKAAQSDLWNRGVWNSRTDHHRGAVHPDT